MFRILKYALGCDLPAGVDVLEADPHILVTDALLHYVAYRQHLPGHAESSALHLELCVYPRHSWCYTGSLLTVNAVNGRVIYKIGRYRPEYNAWEAAWPD